MLLLLGKQQEPSEAIMIRFEISGGEDGLRNVTSQTKRTDNVPIQTKLIRNIENH